MKPGLFMHHTKWTIDLELRKLARWKTGISSKHSYETKPVELSPGEFPFFLSFNRCFLQMRCCLRALRRCAFWAAVHSMDHLVVGVAPRMDGLFHGKSSYMGNTMYIIYIYIWGAIYFWNFLFCVFGFFLGGFCLEKEGRKEGD